MAEKSAYLLDEKIVRKNDVLSKLENLGVQKGMLLLLDIDTRFMGHLLGGTQMLVEAFMEAVGYEGTLVIPTFTPQLLDPACQKNRISRQYWNDLRQHTYPFDKKLSEPYGSDAFVYQFLRNDGVARSYHPLYSFAAWGKYAKLICDKHPLHFALGKDSPLGKIYDLDGYCVLMGADYEQCTMFHMARYTEEQFPVCLVSAPIEDKDRKWKNLLDIQPETKSFDEIGKVMEQRNIVNIMHLGGQKCKLFSAKEAVHMAATHYELVFDDYKKT